jgi:2-phosphosulfolactate phosphatase
MYMNAELFLTPVPFDRVNLTNKSVVAIDILRCSTSICAALQAGAREIIPVPGPGEAGDLWAKIGREQAVLAGEREGVKIENFQLGNSPAEFTAENVAGKTVVMTTTNGTQVYGKTKGAKLVVTGALVNVRAVTELIARDGRDLVVVCSGHEGGFSIEDTLCGGMILDLLTSEHQMQLELNDAGSLALLLYRSNRDNLQEAIAQGEHGRYLQSIGFSGDVATASSVDSMPVVPVMVDGRLIVQSVTEHDLG